MSAWSAEFSHRYFRTLLGAATTRFECHRLAEATVVRAGGRDRPVLFFRHDLDVDPLRAVAMAEIEVAHGVAATYHVMANSAFYRVDSLEVRSALRHLSSLGHEVGLHFDFDDEHERRQAPSLEAVEEKISAACRCVEDVVGTAVRSVSFHRPLPGFLRGPSTVAGRVNAYACELMDWYLSDSKGAWREGEPLPRLVRPERPVLQLLIHPIWWGEEHRAPAERLQDFFAAATRGFSRERAEAFRLALIENLGIHVEARRQVRDGYRPMDYMERSDEVADPVAHAVRRG